MAIMITEVITQGTQTPKDELQASRLKRNEQREYINSLEDTVVNKSATIKPLQGVIETKRNSLATLELLNRPQNQVQRIFHLSPVH